MKVVHCKREKYDVYIGRPSKWGNPFSIGKDGTREEVIIKYEEWARNNSKLLNDLHELKGKILGCWCLKTPIDCIRKNKQCHGEVLMELVGGNK